MLISVNLWLKNLISHGFTQISLISDFHSIYGLGFGRDPFMAVCSEGVVFRCITVNVKKKLMKPYSVFWNQTSLRLDLCWQQLREPAISPLSWMAVALTKSVAGRYKNVPVQDFYMGLDFTKIVFRARLAEGSYLAVQIPEAFERIWDWDEWVYHPKSGQVVNRDDEAQLIPYNYIVFSVSRYDGD